MNIEQQIKIYNATQSISLNASIDESVVYLKCICGFTNVINSEYTFNNLILSIKNIIECYKCKKKFKIMNGVLMIIENKENENVNKFTERNDFVKYLKQKKGKDGISKQGVKFTFLERGKQ
jgi:hypothetical protein